MLMTPEQFAAQREARQAERKRRQREGGSKGGLRAAANMTPGQRSERARKASAARWAKAPHGSANHP